MTPQDVFVQILCEISGKSKTEAENFFDTIKHIFPKNHTLDKELTPEAAEKMLSDLQKEKDGIFKWLVNGAREFEKKH